MSSLNFIWTLSKLGLSFLFNFNSVFSALSIIWGLFTDLFTGKKSHYLSMMSTQFYHEFGFLTESIVCSMEGHSGQLRICFVVLGSFLAIFWWFFGDFWQFFGSFLAVFWQFIGSFLAIFWAVLWQFLGSFFSIFLAFFWQFLSNF